MCAFCPTAPLRASRVKRPLTAGPSVRARRLLRISRLALHLGVGLLTAALVFPIETRAARRKTLQRWSARLLAILAVRLHVHGTPHGERPLMLVANHVSWLDIFAIDAALPARFIAKSEIAAWPVLGWLCARAGTLFIERARPRDMARITAEARAALEAGDVLAVFPEGTTTDGTRVLGFHSSLLAPAAQASVQPVAIRYERTDGSVCVEAAYDGDRTLWDVVKGVTRERALHAHVWFLPALPPDARHRRHLASEARDVIVRTLFPEAQRSRSAPHGGLPA